MIMTYFTERPFREVSEDEVFKNQAYFGLTNRFFDREAGARLYNEYLDETVFAEEMGYDAVMLNEHHGTPFCMGAVMNVEASILARITGKLKTALAETAELWRAYGEAAAQVGYQAGPENFGYLQHVIVTDNEAKAEGLGRAMLYGGGMAGFARPEHTLPPGYNSREATRRLARSLSSGLASGGVFNSTAEVLGVRRSGADRPDTQEQLRHGEISIAQARAAVQATYP